VIVRRPDREELLAVRDGVWSYDELITQDDILETKIKEAAKNSALPENVDEEALNLLCVSIVEEILHADS